MGTIFGAKYKVKLTLKGRHLLRQNIIWLLPVLSRDKTFTYIHHIGYAVHVAAQQPCDVTHELCAFVDIQKINTITTQNKRFVDDTKYVDIVEENSKKKCGNSQGGSPIEALGARLSNDRFQT
uniref:Uncharacterized protein n=1 Tax=Glossina pallidipes TaxID=7398 RepID=A0A1A9ZJS4_GLOPL